jgi:hypothetical protein
MPKFAEHIEVVTNQNGGVALFVDGEKFPWHCTEDGVATTTPRPGTGLPTATVTLLAERVEVRDEREGKS